MSHLIVAKVAGATLLVLGGQGLVRLLFNHADGGLLEFVRGGLPVWVGANIILLVVGIALALWGRRPGAEG